MAVLRDVQAGRFLLFPIIFALIPAGLAESRDPIRWRTGAEDTAIQTSEKIREAITAVASTPGSRHLVVQFDAPVGPDQRSRLEAAGLRLLSYLGGNAFFASVSNDTLDTAGVSQTESLTSAQPIRRLWKLHRSLAEGRAPAWAIAADGREVPAVAAYVVFHRDVALVPEALEVVARHGATIRSQLSMINALVIELPLANIPALADEDAVQWIEPPLPPLEAVNDISRQITEAEVVQAAPYDLDGFGVTVLVFDGGNALESHLDFGGRLTARDGGGVSGHATHVACTVGGDGTVSEGTYRGMAPGVTIESYEFHCCPSGFLYSDPGDIEEDYSEAINVYGADIANNSIGTNVCKNGLDCEWTGDYGVTAQLIDSIVRGSLGEPFRIVWANGNERGCTRCRDEGVHTPEGYHSTAPPACAKNHITVGALGDDDAVTSFTSWGPTDDGRLKPDISAPGYTVMSCTANGAYGAASGTSMAAPAVTGVSALLLEDFRAQFPLREDPRASTVKTLLAHTATDLGNPGPDYQTGYGSVRIRQAIDFMRSDNGLNFLEAQVNHGTGYGMNVRVLPGDTQLKVTLAWDDFPGTPNVDPALVNDLDLRVYDPDGIPRFPWTLDPLNPGVSAVQIQLDHVNNIEQVAVDSPMEGLWTVEVFGYNVPEGSQPFSICASPRFVYDCDEDGVPDDEQIQADPSLDCSGNGVLDECEPDCDEDGVADSCEIFEGTSTDCNINGIPDECDGFTDCNNNGTHDPCDISDGTSLDCNRDWIPDECLDGEDDCNDNQVPDECDVAEGTSYDCNFNRVPDECEGQEDCNDNGILDLCDIGGGTSQDCNENSVPDECDIHGSIVVDDDAANDPAPGDPAISDPLEDGTPDHPYDSIQEAIEATNCEQTVNDIVVLADGVYTGVGNKGLDFDGRLITLRSANGPESCIIDCQGDGRGFHFHRGESGAARIEGLTIRNASVNDGSGILCESGSGPTIHNCIITGNTAVQGGAGIRCSDASSPTISNCLFTDNTAGSGGAIHLSHGSNAIITNCRLFNNDAVGAGIMCYVSSPTITNCVFAGNMGSAVSLTTSLASPEISNCVFVGNSGYGGAIFCTLGASPTISDCTFTGNYSYPTGGALQGYASFPTFRNCILWGNEAPSGAEIALIGTESLATVMYSNIQGGEAGIYLEDGAAVLWGDGNRDTDPLFIDRDGEDGIIGTLDDNVRLGVGSPCIDAGSNDLVPADITDLDGDGDTEEPIPVDIDGRLRFADNISIPDTGSGDPPIVDMGAYEDQDCNGNGTPDQDDIAQGTSADCNQNSTPDECDIGAGASPDCDDDDVPDECQPDCNGNGIADTCDMTDCLPEEPACQDCDGNGIPDECDIDEGRLQDEDGNGVPDVCEQCEPSSQAEPDSLGVKNRYLSFAVGNPGRSQAVRVMFVDLPPPFGGFNGTVMWLGQPAVYCENAGQSTPPGEGCGPAPGLPSGEFAGSRLQCEPYFTDWHGICIGEACIGGLNAGSPCSDDDECGGVIHVTHKGLIPSGTYNIQAIDLHCELSVEEHYSDALTMSTSLWGDLVGTCAVTPCSPPNGEVGIPTDVTAVLDKFKNLEGAPIKARCDLEPDSPDLAVNISDVSAALDAFRGFPYPFAGPQGCP